MSKIFASIIKIFLLTLFVSIAFTQNCFARWNEINTGVKDHFTGIVVWGNKAMISGYKGLYLINDSIHNNVSLTKYQITGNTNDNALLNRSRFHHCFSDKIKGTNVVYACGQDTITHTAVAFRISLTDLSYQIIYRGIYRSSLNQLAYSAYLKTYVAVGDNGLFLILDNNTFKEAETNFTDDLLSVACINSSSANDLLLGTSSGITKAYFGFNTVSYRYEIELQEYVSSDKPVCGLTYDNATNIYGVGKCLYYYNHSVFDELTNFKPDVLNGQCILRNGSAIFVGTSHGIYKMFKTETLELMDGTGDYSVDCFWYLPSDSKKNYGCGPNGNLYLTNDNGGGTYPYAKLNLLGSCVNANQNLYATTGSSEKCEWWVDGKFYQSTCQKVSYLFDKVGEYKIQMIVMNQDSLRDTTAGIFHVVDPPNTALDFDLTDTVVCLGNGAQVNVSHADSGYYYYLYGQSQKSFESKNSAVCLSDTFNFISGKILESGTYKLGVNHSNASCVSMANRTIYIKVQNVTSEFHSRYINADIKDTLAFNALSDDAEHFHWDFSPKPDWSEDSVRKARCVFSKTGRITVTLETWSDDGCHDIRQTTSTNVYREASVPDDCWNLFVGGDSLHRLHITYPEEMRRLSLADDDGYLITGTYRQGEKIYSRGGLDYELPYASSCLIKYSQNGILKWICSAPCDAIDQQSITAFNDLISTTDGNIILANRSYGFTDNTGKDYSTISSQILKLNQQGELIWELKSKWQDLFIPVNIFPMSDGDFMLFGSYYNQFQESKVQLYLNGILSDSLQGYKDTKANSFWAFSKFNAEGKLVWHRPLELFNYNIPKNIVAHGDSFGNVTIAGHVFRNIYAHDRRDETIDTLISNAGTSDDHRVFILKLDTAGRKIWNMNILSPKAPLQNIEVNDLISEPDGRFYFTGANTSGYGDSTDAAVITNADGSRNPMYPGRFYVASVNKNGICQWVTGTQPQRYSAGYDLVKDQGKLYVLGRSFNQDRKPGYLVFNHDSTGWDTLGFQTESDYFVTRFDTNGYCETAFVNGLNVNFDGYRIDYFNRMTVKNGRIALHKTFPMYEKYQINYRDFGNIVSPHFPYYTNSNLVSFVPECGFVFYPKHGCKTIEIPTIEERNNCGAYKSPNGTVYSKSGIYKEVNFINFGCDTFQTINQLNLTINSGFSDTIQINSCKSYITPSGQLIRYSGFYTDTLISSTGCDSVLTMDINIGYAEKNYADFQACNLFTSPSGKEIVHSGIYTDTFHSSIGCDSLIEMLVTINYDTSIHFSDTVCQVFRSLSGKKWTTSGTYKDTTHLLSGCSQFNVYDVDIANLSGSVIQEDSGILCQETRGKIQWYDCDTKSKIKGENNRKYYPTNSGNYSAILSFGGCSDTTECFNFKSGNIALKDLRNVAWLIPNPNNGRFAIYTNASPDNYKLNLIDIAGKTVSEREYVNTTVMIFDEDIPDGIYTVMIRSESAFVNFRVAIFNN
ncbi:MAG: T9SS type A sorting domain-containing protein [Bacteroidetes bacterium]|nr:T9SS type A sorting domain-containing protein [Bacteroidota bacterium]